MHLTYFTDFLMKRRCAACGHEANTKPPKLNKKLVYLDQWTISELANSLDPVLREKKAGRIDPFWIELYHQLERLTKLHVIVCPESPLHYRESLVTPYLHVLRGLYEHLAVGTRFKEPLNIHALQLAEAFNRGVPGGGDTVDGRDRLSRILDGGVNDWSDDIRIKARLTLRETEVAAERARNASADELLARDSDRWRQQPGRPFSEWYDYHRRDLTDVVLHCFDSGPFGTYTMTCHSMTESLVRTGQSEEAAVAQVREFLRSDAASRVPYSDISALLFAGMSKKIADEGQKRAADHGHYKDVHAIAAFLPYVDAICADNYFAELLGKREIAQRVAGYPAKVFSPKKKQAFMGYLQVLEAEVAPVLRDTVLAVYGARWLKPYDTILEYHREREQRDEAL